MPIIGTGLNVSGLRSEFFKQFDAVVSYFALLSMRVPSTKDIESYKWLGSVPTMREWGTGRKAKGLRTESYNVENMKYETTLEVDRDEVADDQTGQIMIRVRELAKRAATHKDYLLAQLLLNGSTAGFNSYDGVPFFDASHESGASGTQANETTFDISTVDSSADNVDAPTPTQCQAVFGHMLGIMQMFLDDQGEVIPVSESGLVMVVHPQVARAWRTALQASLINNTTNLDAGAATVVGLPWLTDKSVSYLLKTDDPVKPFIFQDREPIEFGSLEKGSSEEFLREKYLYGVRARYRMTYGEWRNAVTCNMT